MMTALHVPWLFRTGGSIKQMASCVGESAAPRPCLTWPTGVIRGARCGLGIVHRIYLFDWAQSARLYVGMGATDCVGPVGWWIEAGAGPP